MLTSIAALGLLLILLTGCGSSAKHDGCRLDEDEIVLHQCDPDYDVESPGEEGTGVHPEGSEKLPESTEPIPSQVGAKEPGADPTISSGGVAFIASFEGWRSCPYWDPYGRVWTRGFGETGGISKGSPCISKAQGEKNLRELIKRRYELGVNGIGVPYNQNQHDALSSFAYNLGPGIFKGNLRTQLRKYNPTPMLAYNKAGGKTLPGLKRRREAEVKLFRKPAGPAKPATPFDKGALEARQRTLRRELQSKGCRRRKKAGETLGPKCTRWFREGDEVGARLRAGR